jgi:hypothetical protein
MIRDILPFTELSVFHQQGVSGKVIRGVLKGQPFAIKFVPYSPKEKNPTEPTLSQNYEVYILNLLNVLLYANQTPHVVMLYISYICQCGDYFPRLSVAAALLLCPRKPVLPSELKTVTKQFLSVMKMTDQTDNYYRVLHRLNKLFRNHTPVSHQVVCIWGAFLTNYIPKVVFPPIAQGKDPWALARYQTLFLVGMCFHPEVIQLKIEVLAHHVFVERKKVTDEILKKLDMKQEWKQIVVRVQQLVHRFVTEPLLQERITELSAVSKLLPLQGRNRLYNFPMRTTVTEWVQGGTFRSVLLRNWFLLNEVEYAVLYFQYLYTRLVIQMKYPGFSHNDGHLDNILVAYQATTQEWPMIGTCDRWNTTYTVTARNIGGQFAVEMEPQGGGVTQRFMSHEKSPFIVSKESRYTEYQLLGRTCYLPDIGYSLRLWDFDWSNIKGASIQNQKVTMHGPANSIYPTAGEFYDVYLFFRQIIDIRESISFSSNTCSHNSLLFPQNINSFHTRTIGALQCKPATYENQRLPNSDTDHKKIKSILTTEINDGIFTRFLQKPTGSLHGVYKTPDSIPF